MTSTDRALRFWNSLNKEGPQSHNAEGKCWLWQGPTDRGYGKTNLSLAGEWSAHRTAWRLRYGDPGKLSVLHHCDTKLCCRPDHLFLGTQVDNMADKTIKGRQQRGSAHPRTNLSEEDVVQIRLRYLKGETQAILRREFGIESCTISDIINRKTWKHI